jgi:hypothetical protein
LHDSLHTYDHVRFELNTIRLKLSRPAIVICDNIDTSAGQAFSEFIARNKTVGYAYRDFGITYIL